MSDQEKSWIESAREAGLELNVGLGRDSVPNIKQVEYRRLKTFGNYENETIGAVVEVPTCQDPDAVLSALKEWVDARLNILDELHDARWKLDRIEREKREAEQRIADCREQWERAKAFLEKHGVSLPEEELPF